jgi:RNA polymerase sigma-70 factor (ECF subfamily)
VRRYQDRLFNCVYRLLDNAEDAQDVVQEAFLNAYQSLDRFKGDAQFFTWLYRIAFNTAISLKRKQRVALALKTDRAGAAATEPLDASASNRPEYHLEKAEQERRIQQALNRLSAEHRMVLIMKDMEGQKYETMAEILQVPVSTGLQSLVCRTPHGPHHEGYGRSKVRNDGRDSPGARRHHPQPASPSTHGTARAATE